jgi:hypothetical protein
VNQGLQGAARVLSLCGSPTSLQPSDLVWSSIDDCLRGKWRPPSLVEKLLSGDNIKVTNEA